MGLRDDRTSRRVEDRLTPFEVLRPDTLDDFRSAATLHRTARRRGKTIRKTLDCLIAAVCVRGSCPILHNDRDFDHLAEVSDLVVHPVRR